LNYLIYFDNSVINQANLKELYMFHNKLTSLPVSLIGLHNLYILIIHNNPIEYTSQILPRFIEEVHNRRTRFNSGLIYNDTQSVHNSSIQKSVYDSLYRILSDKVLQDFILNNEVLSGSCKQALIEYSEYLTIHSLLKVTFKETLGVVLSIIIRHPEKNEILQILNQEMSDAMCMCFTGRMTRLLNTLNGFDPRVFINISDNEQIAAIIEIARKKTNDTSEQRELVTNEMTERGYSNETIDEWTQYL